MHADAFEIDDTLVETLLAEQYPGRAGRPLRRLASAGSDNVIYRLGDDLCVRLPLTPRAGTHLLNEVRTLPHLPPLPLDVPIPLFEGRPSADYPAPWAIYPWLTGEAVSTGPLRDERAAAGQIAAFLAALQAADASAAPRPGPHNNFRGCPLDQRSDPTLSAIDQIADLFGKGSLRSVWAQSLDQPPWPGPPIWIHGDIHAANLLMRDGTLCAVIDFGLMGAGDPAVDLIVAWSLFGDAGRDAFRASRSVDEPTWLRGRGWALSTAVIALAYYRETNRYLSEMSIRVIGRCLADAGLAP